MNQTVCVEETCIHCRSIAECQDAIRHVQEAYKRRSLGEITHEDLVSLNKARFGGSVSHPRKYYSLRRHWREILAGNMVFFKDKIRDITEAIPERRPAERAKVLKSDRGEEYANLMEELAKNHWYSPHISDGKLMFRTDIQYAGFRKDMNQVEAELDFPHEPDVEELSLEDETFG
ncbi:MAG: hypothetical protein A4E65_02293 [Syntrophorhabdus sp. PtaU1.Bin153]|nr:MAG: hypothetical protein A4E65_02293 [Syntrophorhabdus sp. PtaU1.Bin153]